MDIAIATGLGEARNAIVVASADAVVAVGGEFGTLSEIAFALRAGKPVVGLETWELHRGGRPVDGVLKATDVRNRGGPRPAERSRAAAGAAAVAALTDQADVMRLTQVWRTDPVVTDPNWWNTMAPLTLMKMVCGRPGTASRSSSTTPSRSVPTGKSTPLRLANARPPDGSFSSTPMNCTFTPFDASVRAKRARAGISDSQGPHHEAKNVITTGSGC